MTLPRPLLPDREFFNIGEASRIAQVPDYTLRYWESRLKLLRPVRRTSGHRRYTKRDLELILRVKDLTQRRHMTLMGARRLLLRESRGDPSDSTPPAAPAESHDGAEGKARSTVTLKLIRDLRSELRSLLSELSE